MMAAGSYLPDPKAHVADNVAAPRDHRCDQAAAVVFQAAVGLRCSAWASTWEILLGVLDALSALHRGLRGKGVQMPVDMSATVAIREAGSSEWGRSCSDYDVAFGIRRYDRLTHDQMVWGVLPLLDQMLRDLYSAPISTDDRVNLMLGAARLLGGYTASQAPAARKGSVSAMCSVFALGRPSDLLYRLFTVGRCGPLQRWRLGHRIYAHANRRAADLVRRAADALLVDVDQATTLLMDAAVEVTFITSAMQYAAAVSAEEYAVFVRPTMKPPAVSEELTGVMNLDHRSYRGAVEQLLARLHDGLPDHREFRVALDQLLSLDIADLEAHVVLTQRLVGGAPALTQHDHASAVTALRAMLVERMNRYSPLMLRPIAH